MTDALTDTVLLERLKGTDVFGLTLLLTRRPDVLAGVPPRDLADLAERLSQPRSLIYALRTLSLPCLQLAEAAQALGSGSTPADLAGFLAATDVADSDQHRANVDRVIDELVTVGVMSVGSDASIELAEGLCAVFTDPLGLGQPYRVLLEGQTVDAMRRIQGALGLPRGKKRAEALQSLLDFLTDPDNLVLLVASAPSDVLGYLIDLASDDSPEDLNGHDLKRYALRHKAVAWAEPRGLMIKVDYGYDIKLPTEVARVLRGPDYRAPFDPTSPPVPVHPVDAGRLEADSAVAATAFADRMLAVLDHAARTPIPLLKTGGVGTRELTKLAKATGAGELDVRMTLELADAAGLLDFASNGVAVSDAFRQWRDHDPGERLATMLGCWWQSGAALSATRDADGKALRALVSDHRCLDCLAARTAMFETLADLDGGTDRASMAEAAFWRRPTLHLAEQDAAEPFATQWREAQMLGVLADGALTALGRALLGADADAVREQARKLLPASADQASFGSDLTAFVAGAPSARVSAILDSAADREGRGAAATWRFSAASVRRALDEGTTGEALLDALTQLATVELPQPLRYLIADVARRHGHLRLTSVTSCICSDDEALLAEVSVERKLSKLGLRLLAPTVLASDAPVSEVMKALRAAGYFPVSADGTGNVVQLAGRRRGGRFDEQSPEPEAWSEPTRPAAPEQNRPDPRAIATALVRVGVAKPAALTATERRLIEAGATLSSAEIRQLAHAVDASTRVRISYQSATGAITDRAIVDLELVGGSVYAWCELRDDARVFTLSRIQSVVAL
ncbi:MAG: helicase-associated domain-containing protein [Actinomycetes bacterium]